MDNKPLGINKPLRNTCQRCAGLLAIEAIAWEHQQWYCLNCGWRTCPVMAQNRALYPHPRKQTTQPRRYPICLIA